MNKGKSEIDKEIINEDDKEEIINEDDKEEIINEDDKEENWFKTLLKHIQSTNSVLSSTFKSIFK